MNLVLWDEHSLVSLCRILWRDFWMRMFAIGISEIVCPSANALKVATSCPRRNRPNHSTGTPSSCTAVYTLRLHSEHRTPPSWQEWRPLSIEETTTTADSNRLEKGKFQSRLDTQKFTVKFTKILLLQKRIALRGPSRWAGERTTSSSSRSAR